MKLTDRELDVLKRISDGRTAKGIAADIGLSEDTLKDYSFRIRWKLNAKTIPHAVAIAVRARLV